ncbi:unnamed protein product [Ceratitis capitata]|uniref:(Mediterranean fruit fly) hypothetical protein n=1 Tax=Ceratitis capitata TaxID=7213 RepID=A0A811VH71_CERCA|nr:unnamed protein product [Ceratitis capitata]
MENWVGDNVSGKTGSSIQTTDAQHRNNTVYSVKSNCHIPAANLVPTRNVTIQVSLSEKTKSVLVSVHKETIKRFSEKGPASSIEGKELGIELAIREVLSEEFL